MSSQWSVFRSVFDTIIRRGGDAEAVNTLWNILTTGWSQRTGVSTNIFQTPRQLGGLGVEQWVQDRRTGPIPNLDDFKVEFLNTTEYREQVWERIASQLNAPKDRIPVLVREDRLSKLSGDDVMSFTAAIRPEYRRRVKLAKTRFESLDTHTQTVVDACVYAQQPTLSGSGWLHSRKRELDTALRQVDFGVVSHLATTFTEIRRLQPELNVRSTFAKIDSLLQTDTLTKWVALRRYLPPMVAKDWLLGSNVSSQGTGFNGMFDSMIQKVVALAVSSNWHKQPFKRDNAVLLRTVSEAVARVSNTFKSNHAVVILNGW
jgi:hypothetical protein